jgi:hypothetical protein
VFRQTCDTNTWGQFHQPYGAIQFHQQKYVQHYWYAWLENTLNYKALHFAPVGLALDYWFKSCMYSLFQGFSKAKSANGGLILSSSQFLILIQQPQKIKLTSKLFKVDSKIIISLPKI